MLLHFVLLETNGNQAYIFSTNKQKENIGASELTKRTVDWVGKECAARASRLPVMNTSGKAIVLVTGGEDDARELVSSVTARAAEEAPGMDLTGVVQAVNAADLQTPEQQARFLADLHAAAGNYTGTRVAPVHRFTQLPFVESCSTSGLPAALRTGGSQGTEPVSAVSAAKRNATWRSRRALLELLHQRGVGGKHAAVFVPSVDLLDTAIQEEAEPASAEQQDGVVAAGGEPAALESQWLGVVHADGNHMGRILAALNRHIPPGWEPEEGALRSAMEKCGIAAADNVFLLLHEVSAELDAVTRESYADAARAVVDAYFAHCEANGLDNARRQVPVVPILLGADDVTVLVAGRYALIFAIEFLRVFERRTGDPDSVLSGLRHDEDVAGLTAAAGVAIVKPKFPFHHAYRLAEELCASAKAASREASMLDFHVLFDSADASLTRLRAPGALEGKLLRPYIAGLITGAVAGETWAGALHRAGSLLALDPADPPLPRTQAAALRTQLDTPANAETRFSRQIADGQPHRVRAARLGSGQQPPTLFWQQHTQDGGTRTVTALIDALDLVEVLPASYLAHFDNPTPVGGQE